MFIFLITACSAIRHMGPTMSQVRLNDLDFDPYEVYEVGMGENQAEAQTGHGMGGEAQTWHGMGGEAQTGNDMGEEETGVEDDDYMVDDEYGMDTDFVVDMMDYYSTVDFDA
ncbi:hypothetical protein L6452_32173 [Arctium lappa]|uniref:Uncharacterized protein n=1 Tax=Arctium lappa TaxID=4217 RepID=A0ACB8Z3W8_ARCLA|nr:hypothetical protein L6452_32173 [Arctium lappa]